MLHLTLVRHASTPLNEQRRYQGWIDPPLSERGREEARLLRTRLGQEFFCAVHCSDSLRCVETARLTFPGRPRTPEPRLREMNFGAWDGRTYDECLASHPEKLRAWIDDPTRVNPPDGESFAAFCDRVDAVFDALPRSGSALLIAHGGPLRRILARALGLEWQQVIRMRLSPCGITRLSLHTEGASLDSLNDTAHLTP